MQGDACCRFSRQNCEKTCGHCAFGQLQMRASTDIWTARMWPIALTMSMTLCSLQS
jgi:hypothetical protein